MASNPKSTSQPPAPQPGSPPPAESPPAPPAPRESVATYVPDTPERPGGLDDGLPPPPPEPPAARLADAPARRGPVFPDVWVEVSMPLNRSLVCGPTGERLRGRWEPHRIAPGDHSVVGLANMPPIPGMTVMVSHARRVVVVEDPMGRRENAAAFMNMNAVAKAVFQQVYSPVETRRYEDATDEVLAMWLWWLFRAGTQLKALVVLGGALPRGEEEIRSYFPRTEIRKKFFNESESAAGGALAEAMKMIQAAGDQVARTREGVGA